MFRKIFFSFKALILKHDGSLALVLATILCSVVFWPTIFAQKLPIATDILNGSNHPWISKNFEGQPFPFPVKNQENYDVVRQMFPWKYIAIQQYKQGKWPLWNPTQLSGTPLAAEFLTGAFYPLNFIFIFMSFNWGFGLLAIMQVFLIFITTFLFLRSINLSRPSSFFGSTIFALSGFVAAFFSINVMIHALLWTPLSLFAVNKIYRTNNRNWLIILAVSIGLIGLASHLQILLYSVTLNALYIVFNYLKERNKISLMFSLLGVFVGILLTCIQLLPSVEMLALSSRSKNYGENKTTIGLPVQNIFLLIAPDYFGNPGKQNYFGPISYYHEYSFYVGIPTLTFTLLAISLIRKNRESLFWTCILFSTLVMTTDNFFSELPLRFNIPILSSITPTRAYAYLDLSLAILGSIGLDWFIKKKGKYPFWVLISFILLISVGYIVLVLNVISPGMFFWKFLWDTTPAHIQISLRNLVVPFVIFAVTILLINVIRLIRWGRRSYVLLFCLYLITTVDLIRQFYFQNGFVSENSVFPKTQITEFLTSHKIPPRIISLEDRILSPNVGAYYGWENIDGYEPNYVESYATTYSKYDSIYLSSTKKYGKMISTIYPESQVIDRLGADYVLTNYVLEDRFQKEYTEVMREGEVFLYENVHSTPRFKFSELDDGNLSDLDFSRNSKAIFTKNEGVFKKTSTIEIIKYESDIINLQVDNSDLPQTLQTMIINYPGWGVFKNNQKLPLVISDEGFIGVEVPSGKSFVTFKFRSVPFEFGKVVSIITAAVLIIFFVVNGRKNISRNNT
jgi:hypothetical protein